MIDLIHKISWLPCKGKYPTTIVGKGSDLTLAESMKAKYKLEKKRTGYVISSIKDNVVHVVTQLLARKVMRKCRTDEVPAPMVALDKQCMEGVKFNWAKFLCDEFLINCCEVQEQGKTFHYMWLLLSILLVAGELSADSQFPNINREIP